MEKNKLNKLTKPDWLAIIFVILLVALLCIEIRSPLSAELVDELPVPLDQIIWEGSNPSPKDIPATRRMGEVWGSPDPHGQVCWQADINDWPSPDGNVNSNIHAIVFYDGFWYGLPWDYMGPKNIKPGTKNTYCKGQDHLGDYPKSQWPESLGTKPAQGETVYHFASTIISNPSGAGFTHERTNIIKCQWASGISCYPPDPCSGEEEIPAINSFSADPDKRVLRGTDVFLSWETEFADTLKLEASDGRSAQSVDTVVNGVFVNIEDSVTFTLTAMNECTPEEQWPTATLEVKSRGANMAGINLLLIDDIANGTTLIRVPY